ncbi:Aste57867_22146 [Aphanomyces stellatus]|uniref:Aste57867_22146 protein n=1 Tax=Aphanomyces stellatus TaxID=120398 RepID=A0A485LJE0_9STRA|nr:hypothetical protein As57867_022077 [Aphanomyces stellatus]VFT98814.1 Aste57867_22146 [Aphanomyces stellatus]
MAERYLDRVHADSFFLADGQAVEASVLLRVPAAVAFAKWTDRCWFGAAGKTLKLDDVRPTMHGQERVTAIAPPRADGSDNIGSVHFKLINQGTWLEGYHAMVSFIPDRTNPSNTLVVWAVKFDPSRASILICCGGTVLRMLMRTHMNQMLQSLL